MSSLRRTGRHQRLRPASRGLSLLEHHHPSTRAWRSTIAGRASPPDTNLELEVIYCVGGVISPLLANLFMHYCFDSWMDREFPDVGYERYCDDVIVHCVSKRQAEYVKDAIGRRLQECQLEMHSDKTRIAYCKDDKRRGSHEHTSFKFLGYEFRSRRVKSKEGKFFDGFNPAISPDEAQRIRSEMRSWRLCRWSTKTLQELAAWVNPRVQGWINYYGHFYRSGLLPLLRHLDGHLARWARRKYKRLGNSRARAYDLLNRAFRREPALFAHWRLGVRP